MSRLLLVRNLSAVAVLFCLSTAAIASSDITPFNFKIENGQAVFTLKKDLHPVISEIELQVIHINRKVFEIRVASDQMLIWPTGNSIPEPGQNPEFGFRLGMKDQDGVWLHSFGYFYRDGGKLTFGLSNGRENLPGPTPSEFYKALTQKSPDNAGAWLFYGIALTIKHKNNFVFFDSPPPPPPAAPPPPPPGVKTVNLPPIPEDTPEQLKRYAEEDRQRKAHEAAMREDFASSVQPAIRKAYDLASDCQTKDAARSYLTWIAFSMGDKEAATQWLLKRANDECSSKESVAESYYALGVEEWACAYSVSGKYKDRKASDPFHFRRIANASDRQQFDNCLSRSAEYIEKALATNQDYVEALLYKSLIYREKLKVTADPVERKRLSDEASKITNRANEIQSGK